MRPLQPSSLPPLPPGALPVRLRSPLRLVALLLGIAALALALVACAYRWGHRRGMEAERQRAYAHESIVCPADRVPGNAATRPPADGPGGASSAPAAPARSAISMDVTDAVRITWPMEILAAGPEVDHPHVRLREGANRFAHPGSGACEFVFETRKEANVAVYVHCRGTDECSNSLLCRVDGGPLNYVPFGRQYNEWAWRPAYRQFRVGKGLHRLTLQACEDGVFLDRVVVTTKPPVVYADMGPVLEAATHKPPPAFTFLPVASPSLPAVGAVTAQAMATGSLVIGSHHQNEVTLFLRLNGPAATSGTVKLRSDRGRISRALPFTLTPEKRTLILVEPLAFKPHNAYLIPLAVEVDIDGQVVHSQRLDFIKPLAWTFLGPFPDPERKGLDLSLPVEAHIPTIRALPEVDGKRWIVIEDGSCYDEFGVVDLNKTFGLPNRPRTDRTAKEASPMVAYAVTCVPSFPNNHQSLAYGGDDCLLVWVNGRPLLRVDANMPLELSRQVVGTRTGWGRNTFVFKVAQSESYWQLLFEPDWNTPYGLQDFLVPLAVEQWGDAK